MPFFNNLSHFISTLKFRYSVLIILIFANLFIMVYPSMLKSISTAHIKIIENTQSNFLMLLGMAMGFYYNSKNKNTEIEQEDTPPKIIQ